MDGRAYARTADAVRAIRQRRQHGRETLGFAESLLYATARDSRQDVYKRQITKKTDLGDKDVRAQRYPRFEGENFEKNQVLVERVRAIAGRKRVTPGQLALAWVLAKGEDLVPIPGTKRRKYLEENAAAAEIKLTPGEIAELEAAVPQNEISGERYAAANMKAIDR